MAVALLSSSAGFQPCTQGTPVPLGPNLGAGRPSTQVSFPFFPSQNETARTRSCDTGDVSPLPGSRDPHQLPATPPPPPRGNSREKSPYYQNLLRRTGEFALERKGRCGRAAEFLLSFCSRSGLEQRPLGVFAGA